MTPSYVCGTSRRRLIYLTIGEALDRAVERWGPRQALVVCHQDVQWTWEELARRVDEVAAGLLALGLEPGDRIGIWSTNNAEWVVTQLASARAGLVLVNVNPAYRLAEVEYALNKVGARALVIADRFKTSDYTEMVRTLAPEIDDCAPGALRAAKLPTLETVIRIAADERPGFARFSDLATAAESEHRALAAVAPTLQPDDPINIQFTSGTTGFPKGATLTHFNILNNGYFVGRAMRLSEDDRLCVPVPLYHCFGMVLGVLAGLTHGATLVFPGESFEARSTLAAVEAERCTALHGVPTMFIAELDHPDFAGFDLSTLRTGVMAGAPCPVEVMKKVVSLMHMTEVTIAYGMTETSPVSFQTHPDDPIAKRVSTVGRVHPWVEVKIVDERGRVLPRGEKGELLTRGYSVMRGYWGDDERTAESIDAAGWMHSGDLATLDEEGYCNIVGRVKDMIIRGGENIYPREIEEYLYRHPKVQDVQVFGVPDERLGEEVCAWVQPHAGATIDAEEIRDFCRGQIAHYKVPRYVRVVSEFPMTVTGKVQKFRMRERMAEELKLEEAVTA